ncbi:integrase arm-type DNA-binding domain-containing protein [Pseudomonas sp. OIL-1]|uniref:tyrosine-type recombinase/integrase n=1 Tax=Pseudomonas sp. OIL-1 TaxID=2706126 RepID=UPI0013A791BE|nr:integrase arm-type DNA-binding domain-containing protein [Pseudomonas sp. OIL-1]QIB52138.1 integrase arm-type DNA-binding domain-containing protein [Pseudomonas sp. OIL-1]
MDRPALKNKTEVEALRPNGDKATVYWDAEITGFGVRVSPGREQETKVGGTLKKVRKPSYTFFYQGRINREVFKVTLGTLGRLGFTAKNAADKAREIEAQLRLGQDPRKAKATDSHTTTFGDMMTAYVEMLQSAGKISARNVENAIKKDIASAFPKLWNKPAQDIDIDDCVRIIAKLNDEGSPRQADKLRSYMKAAFTAAINARGNVKAPKVMREMRLILNPVSVIQKVSGSSNASDRALSVAEFRAYWKRIKELPEPRRSIAMLHVLTGGQRMQQLARVTLADIDRDSMMMRMSDGKGRRAKPRLYSVPLLPQALECINNSTGSGRYVFSSNGGLSPMHPSYISDIAADVCTAMAEAGELEGEAFTGKVIRATIETRLMKAPYRVSSDVLARLLSHGLGGVQAKHYAHDAMHEEVVEALEKLWRLLENQPEPSAQVYQLRASA